MERRILPLVCVALVLASCSDDGQGAQPDDPVAAAQQRVAEAEDVLADAQATLADAETAFCGETEGYVEALDQYGGLLTDAEATVGAVTTAGADLADPQDSVRSSAEDVRSARDDLAGAEQELADAQAELALVQTGTTAAPATTTTTPPVPDATVDQVEAAEADLQAAFEGVTDETPLSTATEQVNAAAFALQVAWLRVLADAGCLADDQAQEAVTAVATYTTELETSLATAGYYDGPIDGVYGPGVVAAVEQLQADNDLPVTGYVDRATAAALDEAVLAVGGEAAADDLAHTAALQGVLAVAGYWTGPIDGQWSDELTTALMAFQTDLGVPATGVVDAATLAALQEAIAAGSADEQAPTTTATPTTITAP